MEWTWQEHVEQWADSLNCALLAPRYKHSPEEMLGRLEAAVAAVFDRARLDPEYDAAAATALRLGGRAALLAFLQLEVRI